MNSLLNLFDTSGWPPRWYCGTWSNTHGWIHIFADCTIFAAYVSIPLIMTVVYARRKSNVVFPKVFVLFAMFILSCGFGHLLEAVIFWWPAYRLAGAVKLLTAIVSVATAVSVYRIAPNAIRMPGLAALNLQLQQEVLKRTNAESRLRLILESMSDGVVVADGSGALEILNRAAEEIHGQGLDDVDSDDWATSLRIFRKDGVSRLPLHELPLSRAISGERVRRVECAIENVTTQQMRLVTCRAEPMLSDDHAAPIGGVVVFHDITDERRAEEVVRQKSERAIRLANLATAVCQSHSEGDYTFAPQAIQAVIAATESSFGSLGIGNADEDLAWTSGSREGLQRKTSNGGCLEEFMSFSKCNQTTIANSLRPTPLGDGLPKSMIASIAHDGTFLGAIQVGRRDEEDDYNDDDARQLDRISEMLGSIIANRMKLKREADGRLLAVERIRVQQTELAHLSRTNTMGELTTTLAHELNQPLGAISNFALSATDFILAKEPDRASEILVKIGQQSRRAGKLIRRIRDMVGSPTVRHDTFDLNTLITETLELISGDVQAADAGVRFHHVPLAVELVADRIQIQQVLLNLLRNALDAVAGCSKRAITISVRSDEAAITLDVSDTGVGLPKENADEVFNTFFTTKPNGMGVGLKITRSIIEAHSGTITAFNNVAEGATFQMILPRSVVVTG
ncbi:MAG: ATP-binding protein [Fuerstiella sp.]